MDIFDEKIALEKVDGNRELMLELLGMMMSELPRNIEELENAIHNGSHEAKWNIAHKLTGSTAYCGVPALQASAKALEHSIKNGMDDILTKFDEVQHQANTLMRYYQEHFV
jgi:two-component system sensor histidine kinase BarA